MDGTKFGTRATDKAVARGWRKEDETPGREKKNLGVRGVALVRLGRRRDG
jgi:hypothetical protein